MIVADATQCRKWAITISGFEFNKSAPPIQSPSVSLYYHHRGGFFRTTLLHFQMRSTRYFNFRMHFRQSSFARSLVSDLTVEEYTSGTWIKIESKIVISEPTGQLTSSFPGTVQTWISLTTFPCSLLLWTGTRALSNPVNTNICGVYAANMSSNICGASVPHVRQ